MTVNDLFKVWLFNKNPDIEVRIWSKNKADYIFSTSNPKDSELTVDQIENLEVKCFYEYYVKDKRIEVLNINVD